MAPFSHAMLLQMQPKSDGCPDLRRHPVHHNLFARVVDKEAGDLPGSPRQASSIFLENFSRCAGLRRGAKHHAGIGPWAGRIAWYSRFKKRRVNDVRG